MILLVLGHPFAYEMENVVRLFFAGEKIEVRREGEPSAPDTIITHLRRNADGSRELFVRINLAGRCEEEHAHQRASVRAENDEWAFARMLFRLLAEHTGQRPQWGVLTGVRPVRLYRSLLRRYPTEAHVQALLRQQYLVSEGKLALAAGIAAAQEPLLRDPDPDGFSLYISIPFCPSRCLYCSFISHDIAGAAKLVPEYVQLLCEEIRHTGEIAARRGLHLQTVYFGGGTPTTLSPEQLRTIMQAVRESFDFSRLREYTVEAGRPDTITAEKLAVLRELGADRISINPQTMDDAVLAAIGRDHTAADILTAYALARDAGFAAINMDLIAGLPGDTVEGFDGTLARVEALAPANITVHTLTVKRSSRLRERETAFAISGDVAGMLARAQHRLTDSGYRPYYLYRQKGTVQNLENVGWSVPGKEGLYNILIMEEEHTILAVGAGAVTKLFCREKPLQRIYNYKFPYEYIARFDEMLRRKSQADQILQQWQAPLAQIAGRRLYREKNT